MGLHKSTTYKPLDLKNPFESADKQYHDLLRDAKRDKDRWVKIAFFSLGFFIISLVILLYAVRLQDTVPVLVAVTQWGESHYLGEVKQSGFQVPEIAVQYQVRDFITKLRTISVDREILYRDITACYDMITAQCEREMTADLRANDPFAEVGQTKRSVIIETVLKVSAETYQVDWIEVSTGKENANAHIRGLFTVKVLDPPAEKRVKNPLGIYIDDYDMTVVERNVDLKEIKK